MEFFGSSLKNEKKSTLKIFLLFSKKKKIPYILEKYNSNILGNWTLKPIIKKMKKKAPPKNSYISGDGTFYP